MATFSFPSRNSASFTNQSRNSATLKKPFRNGRDLRLDEMADLTFNDVLLPDGTLVKDATFERVGQDATWNITTRN